MWLYSSGFPKAQDIGKAIDKRMGKKDKTVLVAPTYGKNGEKTVSNSPAGQLRCPVCKKTSERRYHCDKGDDCGMIYKAQTPEAQQWSGWKTALKPSHEPIAMARKPFKGSCIDNVLTHGVGALNIDATRIEYENLKDMEGAGLNWNKTGYETGGPRFIGSGEEETEVNKSKEKKNNINDAGRFPSNVLGEVEGYQKYFYCPKVSRRERSIGCETLTPDYIETVAGSEGGKNGQWFCNVCHKSYNGTNDHTKCGDNRYWKESRPQGNNHPTVKPVALMRYLIKLVTPPNATVLDPFCGSGSTGIAAVELGHTFVGCELDPNYVEIAKRRIKAWNTESYDNNFKELFECQ
jgi:site-specific DNA-methyltransferase (adenine-specific)